MRNKATPDPETVRAVAECKNCGDTIENVADSGWRHEYTGNPFCPA